MRVSFIVPAQTLIVVFLSIAFTHVTYFLLVALECTVTGNCYHPVTSLPKPAPTVRLRESRNSVSICNLVKETELWYIYFFIGMIIVIG